MEIFRPKDYTVGWLCALPIELDAATKMLDEQHRGQPQQADHPNLYTLGRINRHNVVIVCLPAGQTGTSSAAAVMGQMRSLFPSIHHTFMVGVGGGVPGNDAAVRLGDVVVSQPHKAHGGVVQYDFGKSTPSGFIRTGGFVNAPPPILLSAVNKLRANHLEHEANILKTLSTLSRLRVDAGPDILFKSSYKHFGGAECDMCDKDMVMHRTPRESEDIVVHYGTIASGNQVIRDGVVRDKLSLELGGVLCFDMEAAGFMSLYPGLVIRGICDYADSHKNKKWQPYAAATAAALAKEVLSILPVAQDVTEETDFGLENRGRFSALSKKPEWHVAQDGTSPYNILEHISDYEPDYTYRTYLRDKCPGTAMWILRNREFLAWRKQTPSCLWLSGKIGSGKTLVTTTIIQHMTELSQKEGDFVAHFFFSHSIKSRLKAIHLFSSYIKQMLGFLKTIRKACPQALGDTIKRFYGPRTCSPSFTETIDSVFIPLGGLLIQLVPSITYIVDGLDECVPAERQLVLGIFRRIMQQHKPHRVLVSGREDLHVTDSIIGSTTLRISNEDNKEDIRQFIEWKLQEKMLERQLTENENVLQDIKSKLNKRANLMRILWVNLQIEALWEECSTDNDIYNVLENLPKNLDETYARCLMRIDKRQSRFAPRILRWVSASIEPFLVNQLSEALAIDLSTGSLNRGQMPTRQEIVKCCSNLITSNNGQILLAHQSVRQFLETRLPNSGPFNAPFQLDATQLELGQLCVAHLMSPDYGLALQMYNGGEGSQIIIGTQTMKTLIETPLPSWTRRFLPKHKPATMVLPRKASKPPSATELPAIFQYAKDQWAPLTRTITKKSLYWDKFCTLALEPNLLWQLHPWLPLGESLDSHYSGLLGWAIVSRHLPLLDLLFITRNYKPKNDIFNVPFSYYNNLPALHLASRTGNIEIIKRLFQVCNLNKTDNNSRTALHHAAEMGHLDIIVLLMQRKANLEAKDDRERTALHSAAECGHDRVVRALADQGADVNCIDNTTCTALWLAAGKGHEAVVKLLVEKGANVEAKNNTYGQTALSRAAENGHEAVVKLLVEKDANVEAKEKDGYGQTALSWASGNGHVAIVKLLLEGGAKVDAKEDSNGQTALWWAAGNGHEAVVKLLIENGADVEAKNNNYGRTALSRAAENGHEAVVKLLVKDGANVEAKEDSNGRTALWWAAGNGHNAIVKLLAENRANVNAKEDSNGQTALSRAARNGHEAIVNLLVEKGAEAKDNTYG